MLGGHFWSIFMLSQVNIIYGQVILSQKMAFVVFPLEAQKMLFCGHRLGSQWFNEFEPLT